MRFERKYIIDNEKIELLKEPTNGKYGQKLWEMLSERLKPLLKKF